MTQVLLNPSEGITNDLDQYYKVKSMTTLLTEVIILVEVFVRF